MVVFPTPGGPHKIIEGNLPFSMAVRRILPFPVRCSCPTNSSSVVGRRRSANGELMTKVTKKPPHCFQSNLNSMIYNQTLGADPVAFVKLLISSHCNFV